MCLHTGRHIGAGLDVFVSPEKTVRGTFAKTQLARGAHGLPGKVLGLLQGLQVAETVCHISGHTHRECAAGTVAIGGLLFPAIVFEQALGIVKTVLKCQGLFVGAGAGDKGELTAAGDQRVRCGIHRVCLPGDGPRLK